MNISMNTNCAMAQNFKAKAPEGAMTTAPEKKPVNKKKVAIGIAAGVGVAAAAAAVIYGIKKGKLPSSIKIKDGKLLKTTLGENGEKITTTLGKKGEKITTIFDKSAGKISEEVVKQDGTSVKTIFTNGIKTANVVETKSGSVFQTFIDPQTGEKLATNASMSNGCYSLTYYDKGRKMISSTKDGVKIFGADGKTVKKVFASSGDKWYEARMSGQLPDDIKKICDKAQIIDSKYLSQFGVHGPLNSMFLTTWYQ